MPEPKSRLDKCQVGVPVDLPIELCLPLSIASFRWREFVFVESRR